ncbi:MAG: DUF1800 family protein [Deltaproteobacteria bacterium]|nr:DUF1800 family protein [Deltaproteobacteria bacterium]
MLKFQVAALLAFGVLLASNPAEAKFKQTKIPSISVSADGKFWVLQPDSSRVACVLFRGTFQPSLSPKEGKYQPLAKIVLPILKKDVARARGKDQKALKKKYAKYKALQAANAGTCSAGPQPPQAIAETVSFPELGSVGVTLRGTDQGGEPLIFTIVSGPSNGAISGDAPSLTYVGGHRNDSLQFKVSNGRQESQPATISLQVSSAGAGDSFQGNPYSIQPYRNTLTEVEVRTFLNKVANGPTDELLNIGMQSGLDALVERLLTLQDDSEVDTKSALFRTLGSGNTPKRNTLRGTQYWWLAHMIKSKNPTLYTVGLILHDWFPADFTLNVSDSSNRHEWLKNYTDYLTDHAFGNFADFVRGMPYQPPSAYNLDNVLNSKDGQNQNYARESLELLTLGTVNRWDGKQNYTEGDVYEVTDAVGGFGYITINGKQGIGFSPALWNDRDKTLFLGKPWQQTGAFRHSYNSNEPGLPGFAETVLFDHPGSSLYIADKLFSQLVHANPSRDLSEKLAAKLKNEFAYDMKSYLRVLFRSSAMFSQKSASDVGCMSSPIDFMVRFLRSTNFPLRETVGSDGVSRYDTALFDTIRTQLDKTGDLLFQLGTIFGTGGCGIHRGTRVSQGDVWLGLQPSLERSRAANLMLNVMNAAESEAFALSFLPSPNATASQVLSNVEKKLNVNLSKTDAQKAQALRCLQESRSGWPTTPPLGWNPANLVKVKKGVSCLIEVAVNSYDFNAK